MTLKILDEQYRAAAGDSAAFIRSLHAAKNGPDISTLGLLGLLDRILSAFAPRGRELCGGTEELSGGARTELILHGKIAAAAMLVSHASRSQSDLQSQALLFLQYASALVRTDYDFVRAAVDVVSYPITAIGIDWKTVEDEASSIDIIAYKFISGLKFDRSKPQFFQYAGKGKVSCHKGVLSVCSSEVGEAGAKAYGLYGGRVEVLTRNSRDERLKSSEQGDICALTEFSTTFLRNQQSYGKGRTSSRDYQPGDIVDIRMVERAGTICGATLDRISPLVGEIVEEELIHGTRTSDVLSYVFEDDVIMEAEVVEAGEFPRFSIKEAYTSFAVKAAENHHRNSTVFEARVTRLRKDISRVNWMTPFGFGGISIMEDGDDVKVGEVRVMTVKNIQGTTGSPFINLGAPWYSVNPDNVVRFPSDEDVLAGFLTTVDKVDMLRKTAAEVGKAEDAEVVSSLAAILARRSESLPSMERYKALMTALFMRTAIADAEGVALLEKDLYYSRSLLSYAQGKRIAANADRLDQGERSDIIKILLLQDAPEVDLLAFVGLLPPSSFARKVGSLVAGARISQEFPDEVKADGEDVRRKVCELLGVLDEYQPVAEIRTGKYGSESHDVEFKSSYVFRNDGQGADLDRQGRGQVFEAVCGFLNADGGTLYLGVSDSGDPITDESYGLKADMKWLTENYMSVNALRTRQLGHPVPKADSLDHYVLFLNAEKELYFKESLQGNITIEVTEDADAIRITVSPAEYEIAYLYPDRERQNGIAYVRDGGRTVPMTRVQKERRLAGLKKVGKEVAFVVAIQEAIDGHRKLIFRGYASGNSGEVRDRFVVPVNLFYNDENVYCFDLEAHQYKQFRLHRISSIDADVDDPVYTLPLVAPKESDVFRWLNEGGRQYHVKLRMEVGAKNYLLEEYSCACKLPKDELYEDADGTWILDTTVNGLGAVRRFYLGLADKIKILEGGDSEELKEDIARYVRKNIV